MAMTFWTPEIISFEIHHDKLNSRPMACSCLHAALKFVSIVVRIFKDVSGNSQTSASKSSTFLTAA